MKGKVKFFNVTKGFGFIVSDDGKEYFVHLTGLQPGIRLYENDSVTFDVEEGDRGPKAVNVAKDEESASEPTEEEAPAEEEPAAEDEESTESEESSEDDDS